VPHTFQNIFITRVAWTAALKARVYIVATAFEKDRHSHTYIIQHRAAITEGLIHHIHQSPSEQGDTSLVRIIPHYRMAVLEDQLPVVVAQEGAIPGRCESCSEVGTACNLADKVSAPVPAHSPGYWSRRGKSDQG
jgi:hypothetical protein